MTSNIKEVAHLSIFKWCWLTHPKKAIRHWSLGWHYYQYQLALLKSTLKWNIHLPKRGWRQRGWINVQINTAQLQNSLPIHEGLNHAPLQARWRANGWHQTKINSVKNSEDFRMLKARGLLLFVLRYPSCVTLTSWILTHSLWDLGPGTSFHLEIETILLVPGTVHPAVSCAGGVAQSWDRCLMRPRYSCRFIDLSQNHTPV